MGCGRGFGFGYILYILLTLGLWFVVNGCRLHKLCAQSVRIVLVVQYHLLQRFERYPPGNIEPTFIERTYSVVLDILAVLHYYASSKFAHGCQHKFHKERATARACERDRYGGGGGTAHHGPRVEKHAGCMVSRTHPDRHAEVARPRLRLSDQKRAILAIIHNDSFSFLPRNLSVKPLIGLRRYDGSSEYATTSACSGRGSLLPTPEMRLMGMRRPRKGRCKYCV